MLSAMENPLSHTVFFDTVFTDYPLPSKHQNTKFCISYRYERSRSQRRNLKKKSVGPYKVTFDARFDRKERFLQKGNQQRRCQN